LLSNCCGVEKKYAVLNLENTLTQITLKSFLEKKKEKYYKKIVRNESL
jgi:hypothetical protein